MIKHLILPLFALTLSAAQPTAPTAAWDFERETPTLEQGWGPLTDQILVGASFVHVQAESAGANTALRIQGEARASNLSPVKDTLPFAGAIHHFSATPFRPADFSGARTLSFRAKGTGTVEVALFQQAKGVLPSSQTIHLTPEWKEYRLDLASFGTDTTRLTALAFGRATPGGLDTLVDDIRIQ